MNRRTGGILVGLCLAMLVAGCSEVSTVNPTNSPATSTATVQTILSATSTPLTASPSPVPTTFTATPFPTASIQPATTAPMAQITSLTLSGHSGPVRTLAWSPDGQILASGSYTYAQDKDPDIHLWNRDGTSRAVLKGHVNGVASLAWSPDGKTLASGTLNSELRLWQSDGTPLESFNVAYGMIFALAWSPDGKVLAVGSVQNNSNTTVQLWSMPAKTLLKTMYTGGSGGKFYSLGWSADGKYLAGGAVTFKIWQADGTEVAKSYGPGTPALGFGWSPDSQLWAVGNESGYVNIYDTSGKEVAQAQSDGNANQLAWSPDSKLLAGGDHSLMLWNRQGKLVNQLAGPGGRQSALGWSPDGKLVAAAFDEKLVVWEAGGKPLAILTGHNEQINKLAWSLDGKLLATASADKTIGLWQIPK